MPVTCKRAGVRDHGARLVIVPADVPGVAVLRPVELRRLVALVFHDVELRELRIGLPGSWAESAVA